MPTSEHLVILQREAKDIDSHLTETWNKLKKGWYPPGPLKDMMLANSLSRRPYERRIQDTLELAYRCSHLEGAICHPSRHNSADEPGSVE